MKSGSESSESARNAAALIAIGLYGLLTSLESTKPVLSKTFLIYVSYTITIALGVYLILTPRNYSTSPRSLSNSKAEIYTLNLFTAFTVVVKIRKSLTNEVRITLVYRL